MPKRTNLSTPSRPLQPSLLGEEDTLQKASVRDGQSSTRRPSAFPSLDDAERDALLVSLMALDTIKGLGFRTMRSMFDSGLAREIWRMPADERALRWSQLSRLNSKQRLGDLSKVVSSAPESLLEKGRRASEELHKLDIVFAPLGHKSYPERFHRLADPPRWIFARGNLTVLQSSSIIAVVGTRNASHLGLKLAHQCAGELAKRNIIVLSGLARGIDERAHLGATDWHGQSIAVLGHGINTPEATSDYALWGRILENEGCIISEYLPADPPSRQNFLRRNELQVSLSQVVIPVECPSLESGTGATIRRALSIGTPVAGISPSNAEEKSLQLTRLNLSKLGIPVFTVMNGNSGEFWAYLKAKMPQHDWFADPTPRQDRLFGVVEHLVMSAKDKVDLDEKAIDRLAERLKRKLKKQA